jgi:ABC-type multidrug transport system fused ATPase/permease subunit
MGSDVEVGSKPNSLLTSLLSSRASEIAAMDEDQLVKEIRSINEKLWGRNPRQYECRVVGGSYTVIKDVEKDLEFPRLGSTPRGAAKRSGTDHPGDGEDRVEEEEEAGPQRATQRIETVFSAGLFYRVVGRLARCLCTGGEATKKESKVIAEGINLCLKPGKMYLVLGLPGSGKSTLLKMIANTLPQDDKHVLGGEVSVNGMSTSDKNIVWSVSALRHHVWP